MSIAPPPLRALILSIGRDTFEVPAGTTFRIGRHQTNNLVTCDPQTSRFHAQISWIDGKPLLRDLQSTNGTFVGGLRARQPTQLRAGHRILAGSLRIDVDVLEDVEEAPALLADESGEIRFFTEWQEGELSGRFARQTTFHRLLLELEENQRTGTLEVTLGVRKAELTFKAGLIAAATHQHFSAEQALDRILDAHVGAYRFRPTFEPQEGSLDLSPAHILRRAEPGTEKYRREA